jgi:predicted transcriptional regulator
MMAALEKPAVVPPRKLRAVVFANFPGQYFQTKMTPKLEGYNVEVVKVVEGAPKRGDLQNFSGADCIIAMVDLLTEGQREHAKRTAKNNNLPYVTLSKHVDWQSILSRVPLRPMVDAKVVPIRGQQPPVKKEYTAAELAELEAQLTPPSSQTPPPSETDVKELLALYEAENTELLGFKKTATETIKLREDRLLVFAEEIEKLKREKAELDARLREQISIRAGLEEECTLAKSSIDALARQLREERLQPEQPTTKPEPALSGTVAALKAHNTRLKNSLDVATRAQADMSRELLDTKARLEKALREKGVAEAPILLGKDDLIAWGNAVRDVMEGKPAGYKMLLALAGDYNIDVKELLAQVS